MKKLLLATTNQAKLHELQLGTKALEKYGVPVVSLADLNIDDEPEETGKTFEENAVIKAKFYAGLTGLPTIADDGGLIIPHLNNEPGIKSRRWLGYDATDEELIQHTLSRLHDVNPTDKTAYLQTCLCFYEPVSRKTFCEEEKIKGLIAKRPSGRATHGYPYRALFIVQQFNKYYDELTDSEHLKINHRLKALKRLVEKVKPFLLE